MEGDKEVQRHGGDEESVTKQEARQKLQDVLLRQGQERLQKSGLGRKFARAFEKASKRNEIAEKKSLEEQAFKAAIDAGFISKTDLEDLDNKDASPRWKEARKKEAIAKGMEILGKKSPEAAQQTGERVSGSAEAGERAKEIMSDTVEKGKTRIDQYVENNPKLRGHPEIIFMKENADTALSVGNFAVDIKKNAKQEQELREIAAAAGKKKNELNKTRTRLEDRVQNIDREIQDISEARAELEGAVLDPSVSSKENRLEKMSELDREEAALVQEKNKVGKKLEVIKKQEESVENVICAISMPGRRIIGMLL